MLRPHLTPIDYPAPVRALPERFSLLVWNVHKLPFSRLRQCLPLSVYHLCLFQEAHIPLHGHDLPHQPWAMSPNLQRSSRHFGVLTASRFGLQPIHQHLSHGRELRLLTHKSALLTSHPLADGRILQVLNVHLLLTAPRRVLRQELAQLSGLLAGHRGPLIVAGDFNSWSRARMDLIRQWAESLDLRWPVPRQHHHVRTHRRRPLDHLLYRGLTLRRFEALQIPCSDHNPLVAVFAL